MCLSACLPVLGFQTLLQLLLTEHSVFPPQGLLKARLRLQCLFVAQHRVVVFPEHLVTQGQKTDDGRGQTLVYFTTKSHRHVILIFKIKNE